MGTWEQLDTEVDVETDTSELDQLINFFKDDPCFAPGVEIAERFKKDTGLVVDPEKEVTVTTGCTEAIAATILGLINT